MALRTPASALYLNGHWIAEDGGESRLCTDPSDAAHVNEILPIGRQLVTFLSARFLCQVMPTWRDRMSIIGLFRWRGDRPF